MRNTNISIWGSPELLETTKAHLESQFGEAATAKIQTMIYRVTGENEDRRVGFTPVNPELYSGSGKLTPMLSLVVASDVADMDERLHRAIETLAVEGIALDASLSKRCLTANQAPPAPALEFSEPISAVG